MNRMVFVVWMLCLKGSLYRKQLEVRPKKKLQVGSQARHLSSLGFSWYIWCKKFTFLNPLVNYISYIYFILILSLIVTSSIEEINKHLFQEWLYVRIPPWRAIHSLKWLNERKIYWTAYSSQILFSCDLLAGGWSTFQSLNISSRSWTFLLIIHI
jgi:hypothetical protein